MISYSSRSAKAIGFLKRAYNDIEVYVEDSSSHVMWLRIIQNILPKLNIRSVNPLRGRDSIVEACRIDQDEDGRRRIYIIDGDFDHVRGVRKPRLKRLYRIRAYCIENVLLKKKSILDIAMDASGVADQQELEQRLDIDARLFGHEGVLRDLFYTYAASNACCPSVKTVGLVVNGMLGTFAGAPGLDPRKVRSRIASVIVSVRAQGRARAFVEERHKVRARGSELPLDQVISGKDYLLPVVWLLLRRMAGYNGSQEQFKIQLARLFTQHDEPYFARSLRAAAS